MAHAAVFALSSAWEGLPSVLVEAMACGCAVVSTDCPSGPAEILQDGSYGPLVPASDPAALAEAIVKVLEQPPDRARLISRASHFSEARSARAYESVLLPDGP
jgi:glycosyltransferase involved in cell wall biosynthesis